jgi:hypothetical protein
MTQVLLTGAAGAFEVCWIPTRFARAGKQLMSETMGLVEVTEVYSEAKMTREDLHEQSREQRDVEGRVR